MTTEWMHVTVIAPPEVGRAVLELLQGKGFSEIDWTVLERRCDYSYVDYAPCPPRTKADYEYPIDWRDTPDVV